MDNGLRTAGAKTNSALVSLISLGLLQGNKGGPDWRGIGRPYKDGSLKPHLPHIKHHSPRRHILLNVTRELEREEAN